jgi:CRISPR-associated Cas5-like protein
MAVLLLRCAGPMQAWGSRSRFGERDTEREPTKSGIVGLLCAALGKPRVENPGDGFPSIEELARLRMGVRVDREGVVRRDFHTAGGGKWRGEPYGVAKSSGGRGETVISNRHYLTDAVFLVGLEGPTGIAFGWNFAGVRSQTTRMAFEQRIAPAGKEAEELANCRGLALWRARRKRDSYGSYCFPSGHSRII